MRASGAEYPSATVKIQRCLRENEELIFRGEALPVDRRLHERSPAPVFKEMN